MNKQELINYLNSIWPFVNLAELCKTYNKTYPNNIIDYNNLRNTLNGKAPNRLSAEKLIAFYDFLTKDIFQDKFKLKGNELCSSEIEEIIKNKTTEMISQVSEALKHGFSNK